MQVPPFVTITQDTVRGCSDRKVKSGTTVYVLAHRQDEDGLKLLVRIGDYGQPFQVNATVTDSPVQRVSPTYYVEYTLCGKTVQDPTVRKASFDTRQDRNEFIKHIDTLIVISREWEA